MATEPTPSAVAVDPNKAGAEGCRRGFLWTIGAGAVLLVLALILGRSGGGGKSTDIDIVPTVYLTDEPPTVASSDPCVVAFRYAAGIDPMHDTVSDLDGAMRACGGIDEWIAANDDARAIDGDPVEFLFNRCQNASTAVQSMAACREVLDLYPRGMYDPPYVAP